MHRLPAHVKILAAVTTILVIVLTPPQAVWAFVAYTAIVLATITLSGIGFGTVLPRMIVEIPFVAFALMMPILGIAPKIEVGPLLLSEPGLWVAWGLLAKATLGVLISITLAATTPVAEVIDGLHRLRTPDLFVSIFSSMVRYLNVVGEEFRRMERARAARGFTARGPKSWPTLAQSLGSLFIRSYERGERVHLAMLSRGYCGRMPDLADPAAVTPTQWAQAFTIPVAVTLIASLAVVSKWQ